MPRIIVDTYEYGDPAVKEASERIRDLIREAAMRRARRFHREAAVILRPGWLDPDPPSWRFPFFSPRWRPFDWEVDA